MTLFKDTMYKLAFSEDVAKLLEESKPQVDSIDDYINIINSKKSDNKEDLVEETKQKTLELDKDRLKGNVRYEQAKSEMEARHRRELAELAQAHTLAQMKAMADKYSNV